MLSLAAADHERSDRDNIHALVQVMVLLSLWLPARMQPPLVVIQLLASP
jgi:hypothetical protein